MKVAAFFSDGIVALRQLSKAPFLCADVNFKGAIEYKAGEETITAKRVRLPIPDGKPSVLCMAVQFGPGRAVIAMTAAEFSRQFRDFRPIQSAPSPAL